ncbi:hypothetical protein CK820_G0055596 [Pan troglodytes]|uniref:Uncharacterized protein n=1 Tax=Pan troglodytes TaxID=9598 RepID=A0A2J8ILG5_PANTR|nr:hypothetical protein CK820_G0055596 [Pan troglodytes]
MWLVFRRPHPRPSWPLRAALGFGRRQSSLRCFPILPSARPYVSANPTLRGGRLRQDPESETGVGDLPDPVTTLVLLRNRLPLAAGGSSCILRPRGQQIMIQRPSPACLLLCIKFSWNRAVSLPCVVYGCPWTQLQS